LLHVFDNVDIPNVDKLFISSYRLMPTRLMRNCAKFINHIDIDINTDIRGDKARFRSNIG